MNDKLYYVLIITLTWLTVILPLMGIIALIDYGYKIEPAFGVIVLGALGTMYCFYLIFLIVVFDNQMR